MSTIFRKPAAPLVDQLSSKAAELRDSEANNRDLAISLQKQAQAVELTADVEARQAAAVEQAFMILDNAGVTL